MAKSQKKTDSPKYTDKDPIPTDYFREWRKGTKWNEKTHAWYMECKLCGQMQRTCCTASWVICSTCCNEMVPWEDTLPKAILKERNKSTQKPQGWHFMNEYVDKDGNVFHKGKEQPKLKGTLKPTKVKPAKKRKKLTADEKLYKRAARYKKKLKAKRKSK